MSETPVTDSLRQIQSEGLNEQAVSDLAEIALAQLKVGLPGYFDVDGTPFNRRDMTIATSSEGTYFKTQLAE